MRAFRQTVDLAAACLSFDDDSLLLVCRRHHLAVGVAAPELVVAFDVAAIDVNIAGIGRISVSDSVSDDDFAAGSS